MLGTQVVSGTALGYGTDFPTNAEYVVSGYINHNGIQLPAGSRLPKDSPLRANSDLLALEVRVGRLRLEPAKVIVEKETPKAAVVSKPIKKKR